MKISSPGLLLPKEMLGDGRWVSRQRLTDRFLLAMTSQRPFGASVIRVNRYAFSFISQDDILVGIPARSGAFALLTKRTCCRGCRRRKRQRSQPGVLRTA